MTHREGPPVVIVTQPAADPNKVPELFESDAEKWCLFCCLGHFTGWCTAFYLGMKYQVQSAQLNNQRFRFQLRCNPFLWTFPMVLMIAGYTGYKVTDIVAENVENEEVDNLFVFLGYTVQGLFKELAYLKFQKHRVSAISVLFY